MSEVDDLAHDIRNVDGSNSLGAAALAESLVALGWRKMLVTPRDLPLSEYTSGAYVEVIGSDGEWTKGTVSEYVEVSNLLHVHTSRGPVTIASTKSIRPLW